MANAAAKKLAVANTKKLNQLLTFSAAFFAAALATAVIFGRSVRPLLFLSAPELTMLYTLEKTSRPVYRNGQLTSPGGDLAQSGLVEYMHDIVYMTWICQLVSVLIGNRAWWLYATVPAFAMYKAGSLLMQGRKMLSGVTAGGAGESEPSAAAAPSKRQEKMQRRAR